MLIHTGRYTLAFGSLQKKMDKTERWRGAGGRRTFYRYQAMETGIDTGLLNAHLVPCPLCYTVLIFPKT